LKDHDEMIRRFDTAILGQPQSGGGHTPWPSNDPAKHRQVMASNSVVISIKSSSKRARDTAGASGVLDHQLSSKRQR
jgi:hypothetical protein